MLPTLASLYSGCGGFDLGFEAAGFRPVAAYDIDPKVVAVYNANLPPVARVADLASFTPSCCPDVLVAGSPCQGFSTAGRRLVLDPRNALLVRAGEVALALRPRAFLLENVPAAASGYQAHHWYLVEDMLRWNGYNVRRLLMEGTESGIPQIRRRLFLMAWRGSDCINVRLPACAPVGLATELRNVDGVADHDPAPLPLGSREHMIATRIAPGCKLSNVRAGLASVHTWDIPAVFGAVTSAEVELLRTVLHLRRRDRRRKNGDADPVLPASVARKLGRCVRDDAARLVTKGYLRQVGEYLDLTHTYNGKFRRLHWARPSPTVDTHFGDPALFLHPDEHRGLTPREAARIQGFPDRVRFAGSRRARFRMVGNAVPPPMAERLAHFVRQALL